jgi:RimJ/RimL family protein N-acetyltransferase
MEAPDDIVFRVASKADISVILDLSSRIWREHYPGIISHAQIDYMLAKMYASDVLVDEMRNKAYRYVIVEAGSSPVGYLAYRHDDKTRTLVLSKLYLLPSLHGKGTGRKMLQYVKDQALLAEAKKISLFVNKRNEKAIRAYERFGMIKAAELVTDIGGGFVMDDYRMELDMDETRRG